MKYKLLTAALLITIAGCGSPTAEKSKSRSDASVYERLTESIRYEPGVHSVEPWENPYGEGLCICTRHYRLYTTLLEPLMLPQVPAYLESVYNAYQTQLPLPIADGEPMDVYLFGTRAQWEQFTKDTAGTDAEVYLKIVKGAYAAKGKIIAYNIGLTQTFALIGHEGWHQFNQTRFVYRLPSWLDEGIATLFETYRKDNGQFVFEPQRNLMRLGALRQTVLQKRLLPLRQLISLNPGQFLNASGSDDSILSFYAQNYALVRFLRENNYGIRLRNYHQLLNDGATGHWPLQGEFAELAADRSRNLTVGWNMQVSPALFARYIDEDIDRLDAEYRAFCAKLVYRVRTRN